MRQASAEATAASLARIHAYVSVSVSRGERPDTGCRGVSRVAPTHAMFHAPTSGGALGGMLQMSRLDPPNSFAAPANCPTGN